MPRVPSDYARAAAALATRDTSLAATVLQSRDRRARVLARAALARPALPVWEAALANRATTPPRVLAVGDSTTAGVNGGTTTGLFAESWPVELVSKFNANDYDALIGSFLGHNVGGGTAAISTYDPRRVFGAGWGLSSTTAGGQAFRNNTTTNDLTFTPTDDFDELDVWTLRNTGFGSLAIAIDGGATLQTVNEAGAAAMVKTTVSVALGGHAIEAAPVSGDTYVIGIESRNTAVPKIEVMNAGWSSSETSQWVVATQPWNPINAIAALNPDLTVIDLGINDAQDGESAATYGANMQALITKAKTVGDVLLVVPNPCKTTSVPQAGQDMVRSVIYSLAGSNNLRVVDIYHRWGESQAAAVALGFMDTAESLHPNAAGYADIAAAVYEVII